MLFRCLEKKGVQGKDGKNTSKRRSCAFWMNGVTAPGRFHRRPGLCNHSSRWSHRNRSALTEVFICVEECKHQTSIWEYWYNWYMSTWLCMIHNSHVHQHLFTTILKKSSLSLMCVALRFSKVCGGWCVAFRCSLHWTFLYHVPWCLWSHHHRLGFLSALPLQNLEVLTMAAPVLLPLRLFGPRPIPWIFDVSGKNRARRMDGC